MQDESHDELISNSEPTVFAFGWNTKPLLAGCIAVFLFLIFVVLVAASVNSGLSGDWVSSRIALLMSLVPALLCTAIVWDRNRLRNSKARIELLADTLTQFSVNGSVLASGNFSDIVAMTSGASSLQSTDYCYLVSFRGGQEIYFDERIDQCWKLAQIIKARTGKTFEQGTVRYRSLK